MLGSMALLGGTPSGPTDVSYLKHLFATSGLLAITSTLYSGGKVLFHQCGFSTLAGPTLPRLPVYVADGSRCSPSDMRGMDSPTTTICK